MDNKKIMAEISGDHVNAQGTAIQITLSLCPSMVP